MPYSAIQGGRISLSPAVDEHEENNPVTSRSLSEVETSAILPFDFAQGTARSFYCRIKLLIIINRWLYPSPIQGGHLPRSSNGIQAGVSTLIDSMTFTLPGGSSLPA